ncbi:MAG: tripartite tricarboxylate transporter substrate binding protein [Limnohabitans sp.]|nr:MAG: tripartite tricarboxylate transporter substrate binding protein [Limnohabitans sp.]
MKHLLPLWLCLATAAHAGLGANTQCIAPAKAGGGFDLTCQLLRDSLQTSGATRSPIGISYQPGGIGALAFKNMVTRQAAEASIAVAFSSGTLLNLAQGRFGPYSAAHVHWLYSLGMDHGVIAVRHNAPYNNLAQLLSALNEAPNKLIFGAGGSIGSQDWFKAALLARAAGVSHKTMRFVAFEGGGEALGALADDHVHVLAGDAAEIGQQIDRGAKVKILAVLSDKRLPGRWAHVPTAKEQGHDIRWPILRGVYLGPEVSEAQRQEWSAALSKATSHPRYDQLLERAGLQKMVLTGPALERMIQQQTAHYQQMAREFGVLR